jgi:hypothetical protein
MRRAGSPDGLDGPWNLPFHTCQRQTDSTAHRSVDIGEAADQLCGEPRLSQIRKTAALAPKMETSTGVRAVRQLWMDRRPESGVLPQGDQLGAAGVQF